MKKKLFILLLILCFGNSSKAQSLVSNGDFEIYDTCPNYPGQISRAVGWLKSSLTPDYYNACPNVNSHNGINVPYTQMGYQQDCCGGQGYAGIYVFYKSTPDDDREYIYTKLIDTLKAGHKYLASMYVNQCNDYNYAIATIGMFFTDTINSLPWPQGFIQANPQVKNTTILADTLNWMLVQDTITATGNETYLTIGNFNTSATCDSVKVGGNGMYFGAAYYFIDGVSVYDITNDSCNNLWDAGFNKYIFEGDSVRLGAINTDNSAYTWINSAGGATYLSNNTNAQPWAQPTVTTTYYVTKTCPNNNVFKDTVTVYVQQRVGIKQIADNVEVNVYPNPAKDKIYVVGKEINEIKLFDLLGKQIISTKEKEIDVSNYSEGVYFIQMQTKQNTITQKIIVQH